MLETAVFESSVSSDDFKPFPIEGVTSGDPRGLVHWLREGGSDGRTLLAGLFTAQPSTYPYEFATDETFHVLEGRGCVILDDETRVELDPGVVVSFAKGTKSQWEIYTPFKKFFVISG